MKKIIPILFLLAFTITSCGIFKPVYYSKETSTPQKTIDSLILANRLQISTRYDLWPRTTYFSSDSIQVMDYTVVQTINDTLFIISVTEDAKNGTEVLFRKELKKL